MNLDQDIRTMLQTRAEGVAAAPMIPNRTLRRVRVRKTLMAGGMAAAVAAVAVAGVVLRSAIWLDAAPVPPADGTGREILRANGEALSFTGVPGEAPGDLVAVNPDTGEHRVLVENLEAVYSARWSADGRWVAYDATAPEGTGLWVVGGSHEPRQVATGRSLYVWSSTGAELATIRGTDPLDFDIDGSTLHTLDPVTGEKTDVGSIRDDVGPVTSAPAWAPDGTRFLYGADGAIYSLDVRSGAHSLLVRVRGRELESVDRIDWSPDGAHIAVLINGSGVYVMDADGSNVRVLPHYPVEFAWSPDGTRLAYVGWSGVWVTSMDGSAPAKVGPFPARCSPDVVGSQVQFCGHDLTWSPDGSRIGLRTSKHGSVVVSAIDADGSGDPERIDELTYRSWDGGAYSCATSPEGHRSGDDGVADLVDVGVGLAC